MIIFAGIDGTGSDNDKQYQKDLANSCINQLYRNEVVPFNDTFYHRGPTLLGTETKEYAGKAFNWVLSKWYTGQAKAVFLGGYSRGAAAMIEVAYWLKPLGVPVECLILFDAVDRSTPGIGGGVGGVFSDRAIADNVKQVIHPMRNIVTTRSRVSFQRCGDTQENAQMPHAREYFFATHGGAGGTPWTRSVLPGTDIPNPTGYIWEDGEPLSSVVTPATDETGAALVRAWAFPKIINAFVKCQTELQPVTGQPVGPGARPVTGIPVGAPGWSLPGGGERIHVVKPGDWLSKLAITYYGDMNRWDVIYKRNIDQIKDPNLIVPGQRLVIP